MKSGRLAPHEGSPHSAVHGLDGREGRAPPCISSAQRPEKASVFVVTTCHRSSECKESKQATYSLWRLGKKTTKDETTRQETTRTRRDETRRDETTRHNTKSLTRHDCRGNCATEHRIHVHGISKCRIRETQPTQSNTTQHDSTILPDPTRDTAFACPVYSRSDLQQWWVGQEFAVQH